MPTATFSIASAADDGTGIAQNNSWPPTTWTDDSDNADNALYNSKGSFSSVTYYHEQSFMRWDTSPIDDLSTILAANLAVWVDSKQDADNAFSFVGDYYDFGGEPTVSGDRVETPSPSIFTAVDITGITVSAVLTLPLTDLSGISKTGFTGIRTGLSAGTPTLGPLVQNSVRIIAFEHATLQEPQLQVTWAVASQFTDHPKPKLRGATL